jgi:NhaA family Na+:H+ antiporter
MSIFIATLAFRDSPALLNAAKLGVLTASACAAIAGLIVGKLFVVNTAKSAAAQSPAEVNP